jgi:hypothetical protein
MQREAKDFPRLIMLKDFEKVLATPACGLPPPASRFPLPA